MALRGSQSAVLWAINESQKDTARFVSDVQLSCLTRIGIDDVRDWLITLEDDGLVSLAGTTDGYRALMEARGRIALREYQERLKSSKGSITTAVEKDSAILFRSIGSSPFGAESAVG
jgi:transcription initiation factor IIE alpha subunit